MATRLQRPPDAQTAACPCRHGDVPAEIAGQRPLLERAAAGDREAFARIYDDQVEGVYRYLLGWTGDRAQAAELTGQVFRGAIAWLPVTADGEGEAGAWLIAMARDAVAQRRGSGWISSPAPGTPRDAVAALALLGDPEREVLVLRLLLGHSLAHTAHLSGYSQRAVLELQLAACRAIWKLTGGARGTAAAKGDPGPGATDHPGPAAAAGYDLATDPEAWAAQLTPPAEQFERQLGRWEIELTVGDPVLADALAAAASLRQAIPGYMVAPDDDLVAGLRQELVTEPAPARAADGASRLRSAEQRVLTARAKLSRRPWIATFVATAGILTVLTLQAFGDDAPPSTCGGRPCPPPTTVVAAAGGGGLGVPLTTIREPTTTSSTLPATVSSPAAPRASTATAPPTTRPATTTPPTTRRPSPTTTRAPTTTAPPTTAAATTTTGPTTT